MSEKIKEPASKKAATDLPTHLYRCPGQHNGGKIAGKLRTYDSIQAKSPEEVDELLAEGWAPSLPEAAKREDVAKVAGK